MFLMRDPRLNIKSRMEKKKEVGDSPLFPLIETGWKLIESQIKYCQDHNIPYMVVDADDFRNQPEQVFKKIFNHIDLDFSPEMLTWKPRTDIDLDNLDGAHFHLYEEVLTSHRMLPETGSIPPLSYFPDEKGYREHVRECLEIYDKLRNDPARILPDA